jgi:hypothetical protein
MNKKGLESFILCHLMSVCSEASSLGNDWSVHLQKGEVGDVILEHKFSLLLAYRQQNSLTNGKQGLVPKEMDQTLLNNKKQGKTYRPLTLSRQPSFVFTGRKMVIPTENRRSP